MNSLVSIKEFLIIYLSILEIELVFNSMIMTNIYKGPVIKLVGKVILTAVLYAAAHGLAIRLWR
jgi:hypothetical protein